jgi:protein-S-isoprenylcysteine O-methyltransferase Ste14
MNESQHVLLAVAWLGYFAIHSALASMRVKEWTARRLPSFVPFYRLCYNVTAVALLIPALYLIVRYPGQTIWAWHGIADWIANGLALLALVGFFLSARCYDLGEFAGLRQMREGGIEIQDQEAFRIGELHRHVRHPWYSLALVVIWTRDMSESLLLSATLMSLYLVFGSRLEERKLIRFHGPVYEEYRRAVPGLVPRPWRRLSREEADALLARAGGTRDQAPIR